jgi:hypothetical protein
MRETLVLGCGDFPAVYSRVESVGRVETSRAIRYSTTTRYLHGM